MPGKMVSKEEAIRRAKGIYAQKKARGDNFLEGPCISNGDEIPGWVVDIAHYPRRVIDDLPQYQCPAYRLGKIRHFVELDPDGNLIRAE
ncbi:MAG: hypothetical protein M1150_00560 [Patescibacteria group bacterium]|nr:hypothetical protein [Patescibacteria group bacterium]